MALLVVYVFLNVPSAFTRVIFIPFYGVMYGIIWYVLPFVSC